MAIPVWVPFGFIILVVGGLGLFSKIYRKRQSARTVRPWFPTHPERDIYISLLQKTDPKPHESLLKAALLQRAAADVKRIFRIRDDKAALTALLAKGSISDEVWTNFQAAEKELEAEIVEVVTEANSFVEGWGQIIFQSAGEMVQNEKNREQLSKIIANRKAIEARVSKPKIPLPDVLKKKSANASSSAPVPSIKTTPASPGSSNASAPTKVSTSTAVNDENAPPASSIPPNVASSVAGTSTPSTSSASTSPANGTIPLPPLTPSKQQINTPPASIGKSAGKKKTKRR